ncbi:PASTA domain-containing protein [Streptosporangium sp. NPDC051023]|uniref:PASTA domain-containing protein n=1 Tax=Streptosporangium sp. NPDC051023 TaxID=3155410 RepID=UPI00344B6272
MRLEEELAEAMRAQVEGVRAPSAMGAMVRHRHRVRKMRVRTAGVVLATVTVAVVIPACLPMRSGPAVDIEAGPVAAPAWVNTSGKVEVPSVISLTGERAKAVLEAAGLKVVVPEGSRYSRVTGQVPDGGQPAPTGTTVSLTLAAELGPSPSSVPTEKGTRSTSKEPEDRREFGGVRFGYLPKNLIWMKSMTKVVPGETVNAFWREKGLPSSSYSVWVMVYQGEAAKRIEAVAGARYAVATNDADGASTILYAPSSGLVVRVQLSAEYVAKLSRDAGGTEFGETVIVLELRRIANAVTVTR